MARIMSVPERIRLFKEINRVHKAIYGWKIIYENAWNGDGRIDIENDASFDLYHKKWVPMIKSEAGKYYFQDDKGKDIASLLGVFAWQAYYFYHLKPHKGPISDELVKSIIPEVSHSLECLESIIEMQQNNENGMIWISSNWLYHYDCYGSGEGVRGDVYETFSEVAGGDEEISKKLQAKYEEITDLHGSEFKKALERYFKGGKLQSKYWYGGYLFSASRERRIKTMEQLNEAMEEEDEHFRSNLEEFVRWFRSNGLNLREAEESLRRRMREFYDAYICNTAREWCKLLMEEDRAEPSDIYLWWGGEPNSDSCYTFLTLFFEIDPNDIGTHRFDERVSRNLRAIINIAEKGHGILSSYREYEPPVLNVVFS